MQYVINYMLFFDAEWVPVSETVGLLETEYPELHTAFLSLVKKWENKEPKPEWDLQDYWIEKSHWYPEFCKIITISYGYYNRGKFEIQSLYGDNESDILKGFNNVLAEASTLGFIPAGYQIKRFDMPWIAQRSMINGIKPHHTVATFGQKPWEVAAFDIPEVWSQGVSALSYSPFELVCSALGVETSKKDLSGDKVKYAYWNGELERIKDYCELDVLRSRDLAEKIIELMP